MLLRGLVRGTRRVGRAVPPVNNPTATLLEHLLLTQGFMSPSKAVSLIAGDRKIVILRGQFWATHSSVAVGLSRRCHVALTTTLEHL